MGRSISRASRTTRPAVRIPSFSRRATARRIFWRKSSAHSFRTKSGCDPICRSISVFGTIGRTTFTTTTTSRRACRSRTRPARRRGRLFAAARACSTIAPPPPAFAARPDPTHAVVREIESAGTQRTASVQVTLRGQVTKYFNGSAQYDFGRAMNDTNGIGWMPPNNYDLSLEYARADFNQRHRVELFGTLNAGRNFNFGISA